MHDAEQVNLKLTRARIKVLLKSPFLGALVMYLPMQYELSIARADTDGTVMYYNPLWINNLSEEEIATAICHTVLHCALGHPWRRSTRDAQQWDRACDLVVNSILSDEGYQMPSRLNLEQQYLHQSAEEIYQQLSSNMATEQARDPRPPGGGQFTGELGGQASSAQGNQEQQQIDQHTKWSGSGGQVYSRGLELQSLWKERVARALQSARGRGDLPGMLERAIGEFLHPEKDWRETLAEFLLKVRSDYSWLPPDRRFITYKILIPDLGMAAEQMEELVIAVDTSGSIEHKHLQRFLSEVRGIVSAFTSIRGHLIFCDSEIQSWSNLLDFTETIPRGGGGTDTRPVFDQLVQRGISPAALVYCTDGVTRYPDYEPTYPVLWVLTKEHVSPPWGRKVILQSI